MHRWDYAARGDRIRVLAGRWIELFVETAKSDSEVTGKIITAPLIIRGVGKLLASVVTEGGALSSFDF